MRCVLAHLLAFSSLHPCSCSFLARSLAGPVPWKGPDQLVASFPAAPPASLSAPGFAPAGAPGAALATAVPPLRAATPPPTTPSPDPFFRNNSFPIGPHPRSEDQLATYATATLANEYGANILKHAMDIDERVHRGTTEHLRVLQPFNDTTFSNWSTYWPHKRPVDPLWIAPPMEADIKSYVSRELAAAVRNASAEVPEFVREDIISATKDMIRRMRALPLQPTRPPPATTTFAPPPAAAPPAAPRAAPAAPIAAAPGAFDWMVAAPGGAPGSAGDPVPQTQGVGYILGPDGRYYSVNLDSLSGGMTTTQGPTTPQFTTTPPMIMGANGRMYAAPVTPAMVMGANGRMYSAR